MAEPTRLQNTSRDLLFRLVIEGRLAQLQSLINNKRFSQEEREKLINTVDEKGANILHFAAYYGHQDIIRWLLSDSGGRGAGFNSVLAKDVDGKTALLVAVEYGLSSVQAVVEGCNQEEREKLINSIDKDGASILHLAAYCSQEDIIRWLLSDSGGRGAGFNCVLAKDKHGRTALVVAVECDGELSSVQALVEGCNQEEQEELINAVDNRGYTVFSLAAHKANYPMIEWLLSDSGGRAARFISTNHLFEILFFAAANGLLSLMIAVLEGCRPKQREELINAVDDGATVLHEAAHSGDEAIIRWLLSDSGGRAAGFTSVLTKTETGETALHLAAERGHLSCIQALLEGCKIENGEREKLLNAVDTIESTVLRTAAQFGHEDIVRWLLSDSGGRAAGFKSVLAQTEGGQTVLEVAGHLPCIIALVEGSKMENGEREELLSSISKVLRIAACNGHEEILRWFFSDSGGRATGFFSPMDAMDAFHAATSCGRLSCMLAIMEGCKAEERGKLINAVDNSGATVLHTTASYGYEAIIRWLLSDSGGRVAGFNNVLAKDKSGQTALHHAAMGRLDLPCVLALVEGCKAEERAELINAADNSGGTVLHWAAGRGRTSIVEWLLSDSGGRAAGFNNVPAKDKNGNSALHSTARIGNLECLQAVVEGCKVENGEREEILNAVNEKGETVLHIAASHGNESLVRWLLSDSGGRAAGFNNVVAEDRNGYTTTIPLFALAEDPLGCLRAFVEGCKVENGEREEMLNAVGREGTILHCAVSDVPSLQWLLSNSGGRAAGLKSSTITAATKQGESALHLAAQSESIDPLRALLSGCTVGERLTLFLTIEEHGWTVLHWAAQSGTADIIGELLLHHPETKRIVNHRDHRGMTALHGAVLKGEPDFEEWFEYSVLDEETQARVIEALLTFTLIDEDADEDPQAARLDVNLGLKIE